MAPKPNKKSGWNNHSWLNLRKAIQIIAFAGFLVLFLYAAHELMRLDPLVMLANLRSSRTFDHYLFIALFMIALSFIFGRAWCGWLCP
ncbi:MAG: 4Fe-4S binding protein, partial [Chloroflexi bacterium]|nr:4Fe-4S binding protein [Chloroflexota bacterium]